MPQSREDLIYLAKVADQVERYKDMVENMKCVARLEEELTADERSLLSTAYQGLVHSHRTAAKNLSSFEIMDEHSASVFKGYREKIEREVANICEEVVSLMDLRLNSAVTGEQKVFYLTLLGDHHRYLAEVTTGDGRKDSADKSLKAYRAATDIAAAELAVIHPIRLRLAFKFSLFYYDILNSPARASDISRQTFDNAAADLHESILIMESLKHNLTFWNPGTPDTEDISTTDQ